MASLKRDTPAGRAALARRRQRAAAVVDHSSRFVHPDDEGALGEPEDSNQCPELQLSEQEQKQLFSQKIAQHSQKANIGTPSSGAARPQQRDLPRQQHPQTDTFQELPKSRSKDPPSRLTAAATCDPSSTSYSTASLPSSDELLERSSQVAQAAASVLASARKTKTQQRGHSSAVGSSEGLAEKDRCIGGLTARRVKSQVQEPMHSQALYETPMQAVDSARRSTAETGVSTAGTPASSAIAVQSHPYAERRQQQQQQRYQHQLQTRAQQLVQPSPPKLVQNANSKMRSSIEARGHGNAEATHAEESFADDHYNLTMLEEDRTTEEREHLISFQNEYEDLNAACLRSGSWIMLRSMAASATLTSSALEQDDSQHDDALVGGGGLGLPEEVFRVVKSDGSLSELEEKLLKEDKTPLRWGDTVVLLLPGGYTVGQHLLKVLGFQKYGNKQFGMAANGRIGWFCPSSNLETWTVLRGYNGTKYGVRIGLPAAHVSKLLAEKRAARGECTQVVTSGDPVLLRHSQTGGLLSVNTGDGSLGLLSESHVLDRGRAGPRNDRNDLLGQLQLHEPCFPVDQEVFAFIQACVPPCPRWILGGGTSTSCNQNFNAQGHRLFLHQTYFQQQHRNVVTPNLQHKLFGTMWSTVFTSDQSNERGERLELAGQENVMLDEVLGACLGLEGKHVEVVLADQSNTSSTHQSIEFKLSEEASFFFDASLCNIASRILPLGTSYWHVSAFIASHLPGYVYGSVMQAFCEALDGMLREYGSFIADLEQQFRRPQSTENVVTLHRLHAQLLPSLHTMATLEKATVAVRDKTGGALLNALSTLKSWWCEGDLVANRVLGVLVEKASIPYMTMMTTWLRHGLLQDPYTEFMIEITGDMAMAKSTPPRSRHPADSNFNNEFYIVSEEHVLTELMSSEVLLQKVVAAGKYWRAVRACKVALSKRASSDNENLSCKPTALLQYSLSFSSIACFTQNMYEGASQALVRLLMMDCNLMNAMGTMKQYFLLNHGEFFLNFLDTAAENELLKELGDVSTGRIQHWLRMSVQLTEQHGRDFVGPRSKSTPHPNQQGIARNTFSPLSLRGRFQPISLINHIDSINLSREAKDVGKPARDYSFIGTSSRDAYGMSNKGLTGVETFVLDFPSVPFPISLVLSESSISSYQLLFRLLFFAKYVERRLLSVWKDHQAMKELQSVRGLFGPTFLLRQRMLHFTQNLIYYFMFEVIEPNWLKMEKGVRDPMPAGRCTVDGIVDVHDAFLQSTLEACLLTNRELVRTMTKLMTTCLMFADQMKLFTEATRIHDESSHIAAERRKAIQRTLNDRGSGGSKAPVDKAAVRDAIHSFKQDRETRLKKQKRRVGRELSSESYRRMVGRFEEVFSAYLSEFMLQLNSDAGTAFQEHKTNLCIRLDYNGFLSSSIGLEKSRLNGST